MEEKNEQGLSLPALIAILAAQVLGVILIFAMLEIAIPKQEAPVQPLQPESSMGELIEEQPAPSYCPHCGEGLPESFTWGKFCPYCGTHVEWKTAA